MTTFQPDREHPRRRKAQLSSDFRIDYFRQK